MWPGDYREFLARRSPAVRERILRINGPFHRPGEFIRGWHPSQRESRQLVLWSGMVSRGTVIRLFGRAVWDALSPGQKHKAGRRAYVTRFALHDAGYRGVF